MPPAATKKPSSLEPRYFVYEVSGPCGPWPGGTAERSEQKRRRTRESLRFQCSSSLKLELRSCRGS